MRTAVLFPYPVEPDGLSLQGHHLLKGLEELGVEVKPVDRVDSEEKEKLYKSFKPDVAIGVGFWGNTPDLILEPLKHGIQPIPWLNADGWVANYQDELNKLPLILTTSNWVKQTYIRDGVKGDNIRVCHIGYDPKIFHPMKDDPEVKKIREELGIKDNEKMILTIGGDVTSKGAQEMFKALKKLNGEFKDWKYVCKVWDSFSARDHGKEEEDLIKELGLPKERIHYMTGEYPPEHMAKLLNACDIYAAPSRLEGFGMIQVEAMACGKPVISIDIGGPSDTIVHDKTGFLADVAEEIKLESEWVYTWMGFNKKQVIRFEKPKTFAYRANTDQLADYTLKLLKDDSLREQMGKNAEEHALKNFHYKVIAQNMLDLINENILEKNDTKDNPRA